MILPDLCIGAFDHYQYDQLAPWVNSIKESGFTGDIVLIVFNATFETVDKLVEKGIKIVACEKDEIRCAYTHKSSIPIHVERFFHFFNFLNQYAGNYNNVIITDVKDVIFQENPSEWLSDNLYHQMVSSSESIRYKDEPWGNENIEQCFGPYFHNYFKNNEIYNVGVIGGNSSYLRDLCLNIFLMSTNRPILVVDQAVYNAMLYTEPYANNSQRTTPEDDWAIQLGTTMDPTKMEIFESLLLHKKPKIKTIVNPNSSLGMDDLEVVNCNDVSYYIVHQWDRIPELNSYYKKRYNY